jgi:hypothetical protein
MKHLSLWLTVILLGATPLAAAAFDYGPNQPLLAANASLPQLPGAQARAAADGSQPHGDVLAANADDASVSAIDSTAHARTAAPTASANRSTRNAATVKSKPHRSPPLATPEPLPTQATWQSLLPGSIQ